MNRTEIEKLIEQRDELRGQFSPKNPGNQALKIEIEKLNEQIRALVAEQDAEKDAKIV